MSKSLRNYPDVSEVLDRDGSDAMRWFLMSSPILRGGNLIVTEDGIRDSVRQVLLPVWSTYYFFTLYAGAANNGEGYLARKVRADEVAGLPDMDRYLLASTRNLVATVTEQMDRYDIAGACESVREYLDALTNWYVRTQRDRFWDEDENAFNTLFTALETLTRVMAPLAPLLSEEVWRGLTGGRSVPLEDWTELSGEYGDILVADDALVATMEQVRNAVSLGLSLRKSNKQRVRQPLANLNIVVPDQQTLAPYVDILKSELNVKNVVLTELTDDATAQYGITQNLAVNARAAGPRLGRGVQFVIKAAKAGDWSLVGEDVVVHTADGDVPLEPSEYELTTVVGGGAEGEIAAAVLAGGGFVVLDLALTPELLAEGYARDVVRDVQDARKAAGFDVSDRIKLTLTVPEEHAPAVEANRDLIMHDTLALTLEVVAGTGSDREVAVEKVDA